MIYAKIQQANNMTMMPNIFSTEVIGTISPYPTVVIVAVAQYTAAIYLTYQSASSKLWALIQESESDDYS